MVFCGRPRAIVTSYRCLKHAGAMVAPEGLGLERDGGGRLGMPHPPGRPCSIYKDSHHNGPCPSPVHGRHHRDEGLVGRFTDFHPIVVMHRTVHSGNCSKILYKQTYPGRARRMTYPTPTCPKRLGELLSGLEEKHLHLKNDGSIYIR